MIINKMLKSGVLDELMAAELGTPGLRQSKATTPWLERHSPGRKAYLLKPGQSECT